MSLNPDDPRVKKTRRGLRAAFISLILQKGYDSIAIQDITDEAETARITFYRHYRDKEELLTDCLNELYEELIEKTEREIAAGADPGSSPFRVFYEHLEEQEKLYRVLFSSMGTQTVVNRMRQYMAQRLIENLDTFFERSARPAIPDEIIAFHIVSAHLGLGIWWLENDKPYPVEYLTQISMWLSFAGLLRSLGIEQMTMPMPVPPSNWAFQLRKKRNL
jgi:AcrR family transcriptional regulator